MFTRYKGAERAPLRAASPKSKKEKKDKNSGISPFQALEDDSHGNCNHRRYVPMLVEIVRAGVFDPAIDASKRFEEHQPGWIKVALIPAAV